MIRGHQRIKGWKQHGKKKVNIENRAKATLYIFTTEPQQKIHEDQDICTIISS